MYELTMYKNRIVAGCIVTEIFGKYHFYHRWDSEVEDDIDAIRSIIIGRIGYFGNALVQDEPVFEFSRDDLNSRLEIAFSFVNTEDKNTISVEVCIATSEDPEVIEKKRQELCKQKGVIGLTIDRQKALVRLHNSSYRSDYEMVTAEIRGGFYARVTFTMTSDNEVSLAEAPCQEEPLRN